MSLDEFVQGQPPLKIRLLQRAVERELAYLREHQQVAGLVPREYHLTLVMAYRDILREIQQYAERKS